jgi:C-terminal processing protease CtpA/Prc
LEEKFGKETRELSLADAVKNLRGDANTEVKLKIIRPPAGAFR